MIRTFRRFSGNYPNTLDVLKKVQSGALGIEEANIEISEASILNVDEIAKVSHHILI